MITTPVAEFDAVVSGDIYVLAPKSDTGFQPVTKDKESYRQDACCTIQQGQVDPKQGPYSKMIHIAQTT